MATAHASVANIRPWQLGQPREQLHRGRWVEKMSFSSIYCRFLRPCLVAALFSPTKWLPKITEYRDTAALIGIFSLSRLPGLDLSSALIRRRILKRFDFSESWHLQVIWLWHLIKAHWKKLIQDCPFSWVIFTSHIRRSPRSGKLFLCRAILQILQINK